MRFQYRGEDVVQTLERICSKVGYPKTIRVDNGSEFISRDLDLWAYAKGVTLDFSRPGKPTDNGFIEAFNSKLGSECLNAHWFMSLADAVEKLKNWRRHYTDDRPHSAIGYNIPSALHFPGGVSSPPPWPRPKAPASNGPKLVGRALCNWLTRANVDLGSKPTDCFGRDDAAIIAAFRRDIEPNWHGCLSQDRTGCISMCRLFDPNDLPEADRSKGELAMMHRRAERSDPAEALHVMIYIDPGVPADNQS